MRLKCVCVCARVCVFIFGKLNPFRRASHRHTVSHFSAFIRAHITLCDGACRSISRHGKCGRGHRCWCFINTFRLMAKTQLEQLKMYHSAVAEEGALATAVAATTTGPDVLSLYRFQT